MIELLWFIATKRQCFAGIPWLMFIRCQKFFMVGMRHRYLLTCFVLGLLMSVAGTYVFVLYADQDKIEMIFESIAAIRELCMISWIGLFEERMDHLGPK